MEIEALKTINEGMQAGLLLMFEAIALVTGLCAITGITVSLAGIAWLCREEMRRGKTAPRTAHRATPPNIRESAPRAPSKPVHAAFTHSGHKALPLLQFTAVPSERPQRLAR